MFYYYIINLYSVLNFYRQISEHSVQSALSRNRIAIKIVLQMNRLQNRTYRLKLHLRFWVPIVQTGPLAACFMPVSSTLMMYVICWSETLFGFHKTSRRCIPEFLERLSCMSFFIYFCILLRITSLVLDRRHNNEIDWLWIQLNRLKYNLFINRCYLFCYTTCFGSWTITRCTRKQIITSL
jgi:hypothetical protein